MSAPWVTITSEDIQSMFSDVEWSSLTGQNATGTLDLHISRSIGAWRGDITRGGGTLGSAGTLPPSVVPDAISYIAWRWLSTSPGLQEYKTKDRADLFRDAMDVRKRIQSGQDKVELPDPADGGTSAAAETSPVNQVERVSGQRRARTCQLNGLL